MQWKTKEFFGFAAVGAIGFAVDAGVLMALVRGATWNPYVARVASFIVALTATWLLNRSFVFANRRSAATRTSGEYIRYVAVQTTGVAVNFAVFFSVLAMFPVFKPWPIVPLAAGSAVALWVNFWGARNVVYRIE